MEYFVISAKFVPLKYYTLSSQLQRLTSFSSFFSWVFGSANSVTRPDRRNAKMVYWIALSDLGIYVGSLLPQAKEVV